MVANSFWKASTTLVRIDFVRAIKNGLSDRHVGQMKKALLGQERVVFKRAACAISRAWYSTGTNSFYQLPEA
jgi:hypothetical protein